MVSYNDIAKFTYYHENNKEKEALDFVFNTKIRKSRKCFSNWKKIDIEEVKNVRGALSYCNKETNTSTYSIDYQNSNPILK